MLPKKLNLNITYDSVFCNDLLIIFMQILSKWLHS